MHYLLMYIENARQIFFYIFLLKSHPNRKSLLYFRTLHAILFFSILEASIELNTCIIINYTHYTEYPN